MLCFHKNIGIAFVFLSLAIGSWPAASQSKAPPTNLASVDIDFLLRNAAAAKAAGAQMAKMRADYRQSIKGTEDALNAANQTLARDRATLSADDYDRQLQELRKRMDDFGRDVQGREIKFAEGWNGASVKIGTAIVQIVDDIKKEQKLALVLNRSAIVGTPGIPDITQDVLKRIDQKMPSVPIELPK